jgi:hypothetical protein
MPKSGVQTQVMLTRRISHAPALFKAALSLGQWPEGIVSFLTGPAQTQCTGSITWHAQTAMRLTETAMRLT